MLIRKLLIPLLLIIAGAGLTGCFSDAGVDQKYFKIFKHIKTDQFVWSYGRGGIYWVSDEAVVLDALVTNSEGIPERGIYQVNMDGSYIRLVEKKYKGPFDYCFNGETLFIRGGGGQFNVLNKPLGYKLSFDKQVTFREGYTYSKIRCQQIKSPTDDGYYFLQRQDGVIKIPWNRLNEDGIYKKTPRDRKVVFSNNHGESLKVLDLTVEQLSAPQFIIDRDAYFGFEFRSNCASLWWLYRDGWKVKSKKRCLGLWAAQTSKIVQSTRAGLFVEHYTSKKFKTYMVTDDEEYPLETISSRGAVLAPDGCRVAYGSGEMGFGQMKFSQVLKVFDSCQFMEDQGE